MTHDDALASPPSRAELLLVVDDDDEMREAVACALETRGFRVVAAGSGEGALAYLRRGELPDLILLDLVMPDMNGWEFRLAQLQDAALASIPVVALSGDPSPQARALSAEAFLQKPFSSPLLVKTIKDVLSASRRSRAGSDRYEAEELASVGELLDDAVRPMRLVNDLSLADLDSALDQLTSGESATDRVLASVFRARVAAGVIQSLLRSADLFAHQHHGKLRETRARVLIVDDDDLFRQPLAAALGHVFVVDVAANAADAVRVLRSLDDYDAVVCRLWMAGTTGADLYLNLTQTHPEQAKRMLFLSGHSERERREEARISERQHFGVLRGAAIIEKICSAIETRLHEAAPS